MSVPAYTPITTETRLSFPLNGSVYTSTFEKPAERPLPAIGDSMETWLGLPWKDSLVIDANLVPADNKRSIRIVHARIPRESAQLINNWQFSTCSIGGREFPSVARSVILVSKASYVPSGSTMDVFAHDTPAIGGAMPVEADSEFTSKGYILADRQVVQSGMQLEPVFRVERRNYIKRITRKNIGIDPLNGLPLWSETALYYTEEPVSGYGGTVDALFADEDNTYWGLQSDGTRRTGQQLSCAWFAITTELVVAGEVSGGIVAIDSYATTENHYWPAVLSSIAFLNWARRDGGTDIFPNYEFKPMAYSGPCDATITRTWNISPQTDLNVEKLLPTPINYGSPFFSLNIPPCLHPAVDAVCDIGNSDPVYKVNSGSIKNFPITKKSSTTGGSSDVSDWPATLRVVDSQSPFRGGFLRTVIVIEKPNA